MLYTMDVATSLLAAKQGLGVGEEIKEMEGADSLQSFFPLTLHFVLFANVCIV